MKQPLLRARFPLKSLPGPGRSGLWQGVFFVGTDAGALMHTWVSVLTTVTEVVILAAAAVLLILTACTVI